MMRDPLMLLDYEAKRRPEIARLVGEIGQLTLPEIDALTVLPWIRDALRTLKTKHNQQILAGQMEQWVVDGVSDDPTGVTRQWIGEDSYIRIGSTQLMIKYGQLIWVTRDGVWIDTIKAKFVDPKLTQNTVVCGKMTRSEYHTAVRAKAQGNVSRVVEVPEAQSPYRIYHPK